MKPIYLIITAIIVSLSIASFAQNTCSEAISISFEEYSSCGNMAVYNISLDETISPSSMPESNSCIPDSLNDFWLTVNVPNNITSLSFHVFNSSYIPISTINSTPIMEVYSGNNCDGLNLLGCFNPESTFMTNGEIRWEIINELNSGENIFLRIADSTNIEQNLVVAVSEISEYNADSCQNPANLDNGICNILSQALGFTAPEACEWNVTDNSSFYQFEISTSGNFTFDFSNISHLSWLDTETNPHMQAIILNSELDICNLEYGYEFLYCFDIYEQTIYNDIELEAGNYNFIIDGFSGIAGNSLSYGIVSYHFNGNTISSSDMIKLYPNPSNGTLNIDTPEEYNFEIISITGQVLLKGSTNLNKIDIQDFGSGIYIFRITDNDINFIKRIVIE